MTSKIRIPTTQFGYVETDFEGTAEELKEEHDRLYKLMNPQSDPEFYTYLIELINSDLTEWGNVERYQARPKEEKDVIQALKRLEKRLNAHLKEDKTY